jgi:hypothetical protein
MKTGTTTMPDKSDEQVAAEVAELETHLGAVKSRLMTYPNVLDVYVGIKTVSGLGTDVACFIVEVEQKQSEAAIAPEKRIPEHIDGYPLDVFERTDIVQESEVYCGGVPLGGGTLGVFALATAANAHLAEDTPVMVTNHHVASRVGEPVGIGSFCDCLCSHCCEDGTIVDSRRDATVDVAIARLSSNTRFSHEILEIGPIRGSAAPTAGMRVSKYGKTTKLTHGRIQAIVPSITVRDHQGNPFPMTNQVRVVPVAPSTDISEGGDSGSVYVQDQTSRVVALHHSGGGPNANGSQMPTVLAAMNIKIPVHGTADSIPLSAAEVPVGSVAALRKAVTQLERRLRGTPMGNEWLTLAEMHVAEVRDLVNNDRRAKVVWQRVQGPAFLAHWLKSAREGDYRVPEEIAGMRIENALLAMSAMLRERGSPGLASTVTDHYLTVLDLVRGCSRACDFVDRVYAHAERNTQSEVGHAR